MHYSNGREAHIGDVVKGKGYNIKHEIIGMLVQATPESTACNCQIACVARRPDYGTPGTKSCSIALDGNIMEYGSQFRPDLIIEYGQLDAFVALDHKTGEVLPPEAAKEISNQ